MHAPWGVATPFIWMGSKSEIIAGSTIIAFSGIVAETLALFARCFALTGT